jgi:hypothetical protein
MRTLFIGLSAVAFLVGCAAAPKSVLPDNEYRQFAVLIVGLQKCNMASQLDPGTAALGMQYTRGLLEQYSYDKSKLGAAVDVVSVGTPTQAECNQMAMAVHAKKQQVELNNAAVAADQKAWADAIKTLPGKPIYCNRIGTQTVCQ